MANKTTINGHRRPCFATGDGIICAGLPRSGTASLAAALEILGFGPVHHALRINEPREWYEWGRAAWCNLPFLRNRFAAVPFYMSPYDALLPWTRANWDRLIGQYRATTDLSSMFSENLFKTYPEARVILVERDVNAWADSVASIFIDTLFFGFRRLILCTLGPWVGAPRANVVRDMMVGLLQADTKIGTRERLPVAHKQHHEMVRRLVPADQLLIFQLDEGWEPLCCFLGVPVPDVPFPRINDKDSIMRLGKKRSREITVALLKRLGFLLLILSIPSLAAISRIRTGIPGLV